MVNQPQPELTTTRPTPEPTHYDAFMLFHQANPDVYSMVVAFAREAKASGVKSYGIGAIFELIRFHYQIRQKIGEFALNNNHRAYYARLVMDTEPDLKDFFATRKQKAP